MQNIHSTDQNALLKPAQVAEQLNVERATVWSWCRSDKLPYIKLSERNFRIRQSDLNAFLIAQTR